MRQANGGGSFSAPWGSKTPEPIQVKFSTFHYVQRPTPHAKYGGRANGVGVGWGWAWEIGEVAPSRALFYIWFRQPMWIKCLDPVP